MLYFQSEMVLENEQQKLISNLERHGLQKTEFVGTKPFESHMQPGTHRCGGNLHLTGDLLTVHAENITLVKHITVALWDVVEDILAHHIQHWLISNLSLPDELLNSELFSLACSLFVEEQIL